MNARAFPGLDATHKTAEQAVEVLRSAIERLHPPRNGETLEELALRLRGSAVLAHTAGLELAYVAGFNQAAHEANESGKQGDGGRD